MHHFNNLHFLAERSQELKNLYQAKEPISYHDFHPAREMAKELIGFTLKGFQHLKSALHFIKTRAPKIQSPLAIENSRIHYRIN